MSQTIEIENISLRDAMDTFTALSERIQEKDGVQADISPTGTSIQWETSDALAGITFDDEFNVFTYVAIGNGTLQASRILRSVRAVLSLR